MTNIPSSSILNTNPHSRGNNDVSNIDHAYFADMINNDMNQMNREYLNAALSSAKLVAESSIQHMHSNALTEKHAMLLKGRGSAIKKAAELSKDISF